MQNLKNKLMYITNQKQTHGYSKQTYGYQTGKEGGGRDKLGVWD